MRQRGPTATALSPGLYMDGVKILSSGTVPSSPAMAETTVPINPPGVFATTMSPKLISISPVLSRIQPPVNSVMLNVDTKADSSFNQSALESDSFTNTVHKHSMLHTKLRKKTKNKRICAPHPTNGESSRNIHSLKMTIRRTSETLKVDPKVCNTVKEFINVPNGYSASAPSPFPVKPNNTPMDIAPDSSILSDHNCLFQSQGQTSIRVKKVDASTSTLDCATITEPDLLGPCDAGTKVVVEGVVWLETTGMLVLNIQWRGRSYMGTLLDASKHSFAPSCMDSGITSALSLLRGQRGWPRGSAARFRNRGMHHYHHHHHRHNHHRHHGSGGSMTTRAAAAAAAASGSTSDNVNSQELNSEISETFQASNPSKQSKFSVYDIDVSNTPNVNTQRGAKRRRRRGAGFSRSYRRVTNRLDTATVTSPSPPHLTTPNDSLSEIPLTNSGCASVVSFTCPFPGCEKDFSDLTSMRYHFSLGHSNQNHPGTTTARSPNQPIKSDLIDSDPNVNIPTSSQNQSCPSSPPSLGRADSLQAQCNDDKTVVDDRFDDSLAPPRLDRVVSISDSSNGPCKPNHSPGLSDEPPAPSPAYSDISDEGTVPAEHNTSSGDLNASKLEGDKPLPHGQSIFSPPAAVLVNPHQQMPSVLEYNPSASASSPALKQSPNIIHGSQNGFYFPVRILSPQVLAASQSPCHLPSSTSVMCTHSASVRNPPERTFGDPVGESNPGFSNLSIPLSAYAPLVHASQHNGGLINPPFPTVYIPGVNSFSAPPPQHEFLQKLPPLTPIPNSGVVNLCVADQSNRSSLTPGLATIQSHHSDSGSNSPHPACHVRHHSCSNR